MSVRTNLELSSRRQAQRRRRHAHRFLQQTLIRLIMVIAAMAPGLAVAAVAMTEVRTLRDQVDRLTAELADLQGVVGYLVTRDLPTEQAPSMPADGQ